MTVSHSRNIVVVAASAGGLQPLRAMLRELSPDFPAALLVVLHVPATGGQALSAILDRAGPLPAASAVDGEKIVPARVYVARPDEHLLVVKDRVRLSHGPRQNGFRPAADPLFRSSALHAGERAAAVVLSGTLDDGALGCATVERHGGQVVVQDPGEADYDGMPRSAIAATSHAIVVPAARLAELVTGLASGAWPATEDMPASLVGTKDADEELAAEIDGMLAAGPETNAQTRTYSGFICPECGGPLYRSEEGLARTYDCLVGHRWSPQSLSAEHAASVERALWLAIRSLDERGRFTAGLAEAARGRGHSASATQFAESAAEARHAADAIREVAAAITTRTAGSGQA